MIGRKKTLTILLSLLLVCGLVLIAVGREVPVKTDYKVSPNATPDPNWELKQQQTADHEDGWVPPANDESVPPEIMTIRSTVPADVRNNPFPGAGGVSKDFDPKTDILFEGFEDGVMPPPGPPPWTVVVNNAYTWAIDDYNPYAGYYDASCEYDPYYTGQQDEWMISPSIDLTSKADWYLDFYWMGSYYWSVDPYDNYDLNVYISTDGGSNWTYLWSENDVGVFDSWTWYNQNIPLAAYSAYNDVKIAFQYDGYDGAQFCVDDISVNDAEAPIGRCCYGDPQAPSCADITEAECLDAPYNGTWTQGLNCNDDPCPLLPPNDDCHDVTPQLLPYTFTGNNEAATYDTYCQWFGDYPNVWFAFELTECMDVTIEYCGCPAGWANGWLNLVTDCDCPDGTLLSYTSYDWGCANGNFRIYFNLLDAGVYYYPVMLDPGNGAVGDYSIYVHGVPCPPPTPGDNCTDPFPVTIGLGDLRYTIADQYTCGRLNHYSETCLGSYDGGEDLIIELYVTDDMTVDITLDPKGTTWSGMAIDDVCPLSSGSGDCMGKVTSSSGDPKTIPGVDLAKDTYYYIMVDTWPTPDCIPDLDVIITLAAGGPENDDCADATAIGDVTNLAFTTVGAGFDGGGSCLSSPNIWYCYTATCTGNATISLCGSSYDTKLAVYEGCACDPLGGELCCNDDACGLQSECKVAVVAGQEYLIEVGGYGSNTGAGVLTTSCLEAQDPPYNDECQNANIQTGPYPVTVTGDNSWSTNEVPDCLGDCGHAWEAFTIDEQLDVTIDFCGTTPNFELIYIIIFDECPCDAASEPVFAAATDWNLCGGDGNVTMYYPALPAGTYYIPVLSCHPDYPTHYYEGPYTITINAEELDYCDASGGCDEYIYHVVFNPDITINNYSGCEGYGNFLHLSTDVEPGESYALMIELGGAWSSDETAVWIDFDQSKTFDEDELVLYGYGYGPFNETVLIPADAPFGETRMRVRLTWNATAVPCGHTSYGEAEDYTINIICVPADSEVGIGTDPIWMYYQFTINPEHSEVDLYIAPDNVGGPAASTIDLTSIMINGISVPGTLVGPIAGFSCDQTVLCTMQLEDFLVPYGAPLGENLVTYNVTGDYLPKTGFVFSGEVTVFGKDPLNPAKWMVPEGEVVIRGDCDRSGYANIADVIFLLSFIFADGEAPSPHMVADVDCSMNVNIADVVYFITYIFGDGPAPCPAND